MKNLFLSLALLMAVPAVAQQATIDPALALADSITETEAWMRGLLIQHLHPGGTPKLTAAQLTSKLDSAAARNYSRTKTLLYTMTLGYQLPQPIPCMCVVDTWGPCIDGKQTATMRQFPVGCVGSPCVPETRTCTTPPPTGPASAIPAASVLVLWNTSTPNTEARAKLYASTWGIPTANIVGVPMGTADDIGTTDAMVNAARTTINASGKQWAALVWDAPSRAGGISITAALTFGRSVPSTSPLYNYLGVTPKADKGMVPCVLVHSSVNIARASTAKSPKGTVYMLAANDDTNQPRGRARLSQFQALANKPGYVLLNNLSGCSGGCDGNWLKNKADVLAYFGSMNSSSGMETNVVLPGAFGDRVTSWSGFLPSGNGQTPATYELSNGFAGSGGTVNEPWQGSGGMLAEQFPNAQIFCDAYFDRGLSLAQALCSSIKMPARYLQIGDPMCTPKGVPTASTPTIPGIFGPFVMNKATCVKLDAAVSATTVDFTELVPTQIEYGVIAGTGESNPCLQVSPEGFLLWNGARVTTTLTGPMVAGQSYTFTATLPTAVSFTHLWQRACNQGGALPGTCKALRFR